MPKRLSCALRALVLKLFESVAGVAAVLLSGNVFRFSLLRCLMLFRFVKVLHDTRRWGAVVRIGPDVVCLTPKTFIDGVYL